MQNVLNHFTTKYQTLIEWWIENPQSEKIILESRHGAWLYQVEIRWLAKYYCMAELDAKLLPTPEIVKDKMIKFGKRKVPQIIFTHDMVAGEHNRVSRRFTEYDKIHATLDLIRPYLRKVDLQWSWKHQKVTEHKE